MNEIRQNVIRALPSFLLVDATQATDIGKMAWIAISATTIAWPALDLIQTSVWAALLRSHSRITDAFLFALTSSIGELSSVASMSVKRDVQATSTPCLNANAAILPIQLAFLKSQANLYFFQEKRRKSSLNSAGPFALPMRSLTSKYSVCPWWVSTIFFLKSLLSMKAMGMSLKSKWSLLLSSLSSTPS